MSFTVAVVAGGVLLAISSVIGGLISLISGHSDTSRNVSKTPDKPVGILDDAV